MHIIRCFYLFFLLFIAGFSQGALFEPAQIAQLKEAFVSSSSAYLQAVISGNDAHGAAFVGKSERKKAYDSHWETYQNVIDGMGLSLPTYQAPKEDLTDASDQQAVLDWASRHSIDKYIYLKDEVEVSRNMPRRIRKTGEHKSLPGFSNPSPTLEALGFSKNPTFTWDSGIMNLAEPYYQQLLNIMTDTPRVMQASYEDPATKDPSRENQYEGLFGTPTSSNLGRLAMLPGVDLPTLLSAQRVLSREEDNSFFETTLLHILVQSQAKPVKMDTLTLDDQRALLPSYFQGVQDRVYTRVEGTKEIFGLYSQGEGIDGVSTLLDTMADDKNTVNNIYFLINQERKGGHRHEILWLGIRPDKLYFSLNMDEGIFLVYEIPEIHQRSFFSYFVGLLGMTTNYDGVSEKQNNKANKLLTDESLSKQLKELWGLTIRPIVKETYIIK